MFQDIRFTDLEMVWDSFLFLFLSRSIFIQIQKRTGNKSKKELHFVPHALCKTHGICIVQRPSSFRSAFYFVFDFRAFSSEGLFGAVALRILKSEEGVFPEPPPNFLFIFVCCALSSQNGGQDLLARAKPGGPTCGAPCGVP
jgi:hypothetical protein